MSPQRVVDPIFVPFSVTTPAGTQPSPALFTQLTVPHGILELVDLQIPPGHCGTTGIRFEMANRGILPFGGGLIWIIGDDLQREYPLDVEVDRGLRVATYNIGNYDHTHYFRLKIRTRIDRPMPTAPALVNLNTVQFS